MESYIPLPEMIRKNGYDYKQIRREGNVAIYEQMDAGAHVAYEVFEIRKQPASEFNGIRYEAKERMPSNEEWGQNAYTVHDLSAAERRMKEILEKIFERNLPQTEE